MLGLFVFSTVIRSALLYFRFFHNSWYLPWLFLHLSVLIPFPAFACCPLLSVCSQAAVPPCSQPLEWIVCPLLHLTTITIQTSALPHSFPSTLETLLLQLTALLPNCSFPNPPLYHFLITVPPLPLLNHTPFYTALTTALLHVVLILTLSLKLWIQMHGFVHRHCPVVAVSTRQTPLLTATSSPTPAPIRDTSLQSIPFPVLTSALCPTACQTFVLTPSQLSSCSPILILRPCKSFLLASKLIPVPLSSLNPTLCLNTPLWSHVADPHWALLPPSHSQTERESSL